MQIIFIRILNMSITAGWMILAVMLARLLLKKAPRKFTVLLWGLVALRLLLPISIEAPTSLVPRTEAISIDALYAASSQVRSGSTLVNETASLENETSNVGNEAVNPATGSAKSVLPAKEASASKGSSNLLQMLLFAGSRLWILGMAALLAYAVVSLLCLRRKVREAVRFRDNIWVCDQVEVPFAVGILRPRIYLPSWLAAGEDLAGGTDPILAHERAHLARKDPLWKALGFLLLAVYWFHPLLWAAFFLFCRDIETACDEKVVRDLDMAGKKAYARTLVTCGRRQRVLSIGMSAFGTTDVEGRVKGVLRYKKPGVWMGLAAFAVCIVVAACFLTNPQKEAPVLHHKTYQNANPKITEAIRSIEANGSGPKKWFSADLGETEIGSMYAFQMKDYLANVKWEECEAPETLPDSAHFLLPIGASDYVTVYEEPRIACLHIGNEESFFRIAPEDYGALHELFHPYSEKKNSQVYYNYVPIHIPHVGDASEVSQIAHALPYPDGYTCSSIKIWSETEPYGLDVYVDGSLLANGEELPDAVVHAFQTCAESAFAKIGNLGSIRFYGADEAGTETLLYRCDRTPAETGKRLVLG